MDLLKTGSANSTNSVNIYGQQPNNNDQQKESKEDDQKEAIQSILSMLKQKEALESHTQRDQQALELLNIQSMMQGTNQELTGVKNNIFVQQNLNGNINIQSNNSAGLDQLMLDQFQMNPSLSMSGITDHQQLQGMLKQ